MNTETGGPAFPVQDASKWQAHGMTLRQYAAIKLKVPDSGTDWLDAMIVKSLRDDFAGLAMQGLLAGTTISEDADIAGAAYEVANSMPEARK